MIKERDNDEESRSESESEAIEEPLKGAVEKREPFEDWEDFKQRLRDCFILQNKPFKISDDWIASDNRLLQPNRLPHLNLPIRLLFHSSVTDSTLSRYALASLCT